MTATMALYWIDALSNLSNFILCLWIVSVACFVIIPVVSDCKFKEAEAELPGSVKIFGCAAIGIILFGLALIFIPSKNTMYMMLATHYAGQSELPEKVLKAIEVKLDEIIGEKE